MPVSCTDVVWGLARGRPPRDPSELRGFERSAVAAMFSVDRGGDAGHGVPAADLTRLRNFRGSIYRCLGRRADELFELTDALLCVEGPVRSLVGLCLAPEHRRGHGALYDAVNCGAVD